MIERAIEIAAHYQLLADELRASLVIESDQRTNMTLTILHERAATLDAVSYDLLGHASEQIEVNDGESLTFIVRQRGSIVACLVNEVHCSEQSRLLLLPKGGFNLVLYQSRLEDDECIHAVTHHVRLQATGGPAARGLQKLLDAVLEHYQSRLPGDIVQVRASIEDAMAEGDEEECTQIFLALAALLESHGALRVPAIREAVQAAALSS